MQTAVTRVVTALARVCRCDDIGYFVMMCDDLLKKTPAVLSRAGVLYKYCRCYSRDISTTAPLRPLPLRSILIPIARNPGMIRVSWLVR